MATLNVLGIAYIEPQSDLEVTTIGGTYTIPAGVRYKVVSGITEMTVTQTGVSVNCMYINETTSTSRGHTLAMAVNEVRTTA